MPPKQAKHDEQLSKKKIKYVNILSFLMGISQAVLAYIISSYLEVAIGSDKISIYYFLAYLLVLIALLNLHKVIKAFGKSSVFFISLLLKIISLVALVLLKPSGISVIFLISYIIFSNIDLVCLDIILESFSVDKKSGRIRGFHLMIMDTGFLLGPLISTQVMNYFDFHFVFFISLIFEIAILFLAFEKLNNVNHKFDGNLTIAAIGKKILANKSLLRIYYVSFVLELFYALMIIYSPIYLLSLGLSWLQIGTVFTIMLTPFVFLPYPIGILADKKLGEKELILVSILIMGISTFFIPYIVSAKVLVWSIVLFSTRIGAAMVQTLRDSYFYKKIDGHDVDLINFFRTAAPASYIFASIISFIILSFYPIRYVFIFLAVFIFSALIPAFNLVDNKCESELKSEDNKYVCKLK